jgi:hypothetical protein
MHAHTCSSTKPTDHPTQPFSPPPQNTPTHTTPTKTTTHTHLQKQTPTTAHALGRAHPDRSGFDGAWTKEPLVFDNTCVESLCVWGGGMFRGCRRVYFMVFDKTSVDFCFFGGGFSVLWDICFLEWWIDRYKADRWVHTTTDRLVHAPSTPRTHTVTRTHPHT